MTDLDARYGRTPRSRRVVGIGVAAVALVVAAIVWFVWANPIGAGRPAAQWRDTGYHDLTDRGIGISWEVTIDPGVGARCALYAMNQGFAVIGWKVVEIEPSDTRIRQFEDTVLTTERAVTGLVYQCWVA
jgi:hypothetical protein